MKTLILSAAIIVGLFFIMIPKAASAAWVYDPNTFVYSSRVF